MIDGWGAARAVGVFTGSLAWGAYNGRLLRRALHMLQLEGYQTARFLRWSAAKQERWARTGRIALALLAVLVSVAPGRSRSLLPVGATAWATLGAWLWWGARSGPAKKPLVLTPRATRLLTGEAALGFVLAAGPAAIVAQRRGLGAAIPALAIGASATSLLAPAIAATANVLLWPVEESLRRHYLYDARRRLRAVQPTVVAVAGSYGKTSTKEFLATILSARWSVLRPPGSHNTPMGISRVIREQLRPGHELFVAELGDYVPGDIRFLCSLVGPRIGVLTTIGPEHLERFGTIEWVAETKAELIDALPTDGVAIVNQDDPLVRALGDRACARGIRVVTYGVRAASADVRARDIRTTREGLTFVVEAEGHGEAPFQVNVLGRHNVANVLAATAAALELGMTLDEIARAATAIAPVEHRLQPIQGDGGVLVIDDAFNSNPRGAAEALNVLSELKGGRKVLVTPGMIELAEREDEENRAFGRKAAAVCDEVILVGLHRAEPILAGLRDAGYPESQAIVVRSLDEATSRLRSTLQAGDIVLFENDLPDMYDDGDATMHGTHVGAGTSALRGLVPAPTPARAVVRVSGIRTLYRERGLGTGRLPVVILHGWGASIAAVASIQGCFEGDRRTIALDLPGFGDSEPLPRPWGSADYAVHLRAFLRTLGIERADLIGHSHGGRIAINLAATWPEMVERLVLVDSAGIPPRRGPKYRARVLAFKAGRRLVATPPLRSQPVVQAWFATRFGSEDYRQAGAMRATLVRVVNEDLRALLPRIKAPTLLVWGENDDATPVGDGRIMEGLIPDAGLVVFPGAGHFSYADDPGRFCRVVGHFLRD